MSTIDMITSHPHPTGGLPVELLAEAIDAASACARICTACADACLAEESVAEMRDCIRTDLDCADVCAATASVLSRRTGTISGAVKELLSACRVACATCADDCGAHADMHAHCAICAEA
ncbi:four-helix bundle copper-binding protein, partial [Dietzia sp. CW19]